jgi:predicted RNase H-like HicB family nuclease
MRYYIGIVHEDKGSDFGVSFPDFPGAVTAASSLDEAIGMAAEALALHVEGMLAEGEAIPDPSSFDRVRDNPDYRDGLPVLVPLKSDALAQRLQVTLPALIVRRIDEHTEKWGQSRSSFLAEAAKHELVTRTSARGTRMSSRKQIRRAAKRTTPRRKR